MLPLDALRLSDDPTGMPDDRKMRGNVRNLKSANFLLKAE